MLWFDLIALWIASEDRVVALTAGRMRRGTAAFMSVLMREFSFNQM